jgi:hypothetical protein
MLLGQAQTSSKTFCAGLLMFSLFLRSRRISKFLRRGSEEPGPGVPPIIDEIYKFGTGTYTFPLSQCQPLAATLLLGLVWLPARNTFAVQRRDILLR